MATETTGTALATIQTEDGELLTAEATAMVQQEIQGALIMAARFPRNEEKALQAILKSCARPGFAQDVEYSYRRGDTLIHGPSIYLARELARVWGNIRHGCDIINDSQQTRTIRAYAWDMQTNTKVAADDTFMKLIQRKDKGWIVPDERELRELTNRRAAVNKRNCILELIPFDIVDAAVTAANETIEKQIKEDPDAHARTMLKAFGAINVSAEELQEFLQGTPVSKANPKQIAELRKIYAGIKNGEVTWAEVFGKHEPATDAKQDVKEQLKKRTRGKKEPEAPTQPAVPTQPAQGAAAAPATGGQAKVEAPDVSQDPLFTGKPEPEVERKPEAPSPAQKQPAVDPASNMTGVQLGKIAKSITEKKIDRELLRKKIESMGKKGVNELNYGEAEEVISWLEAQQAGH